MKYKLHISTGDFCFIETEFEGTAEEAIEENKRLINLQNGGFGLERDIFNKALDTFLTQGTGDADTYMAMSKDQQQVFQEIKKSFARIKRNNQ